LAKVKQVYVNDNGTLRKAQEVYVNDSGTVEKIHQTQPTAQLTEPNT
jgi:hypothetical protein